MLPGPRALVLPSAPSRSFQSREEEAQELRKKGSRHTLPSALCGPGVAGGTAWGQRGDTVPA